MKCPKGHNPVAHSRFMGKARAQYPLRITEDMVDAATYRIEKVDANSGYQAEMKYHAARRWIHAIRNNEYVWLGLSGAATPVGLGGLIADAMKLGLIDAMVSTGANAYHDLHFASGLPVRHGSENVDDNALFDDETTRIYTQFIHNRYTLKAQDMINQGFAKDFLKDLGPPYSTATLMNALGEAMLTGSPREVVDKEGSFVLTAAKHGVPIFLDSGSNHSLGMDLSLLHIQGYDADTSPSRDVIEAAALSMYTQPQLNVFLGEAGPRNFTQTTAPTASEIFAMPFDGSAGCIMFTTSDKRTGGLSGSTQSEAKSWGKYKTADAAREIIVWSEYTTTFPDVIAYVAGKVSRKPRRLMDEKDEITEGFLRDVKKYEKEREKSQKKIEKMLPYVIQGEVEARKKAGYIFGKELFIKPRR